MCPKPKAWQCILLLVLVLVILAVFITFTSYRPEVTEPLEVTVYGREFPGSPVPSVMMDLFHRGPHEQIAAEIVRSLTPRTVGPLHRRLSEGPTQEHLHLLIFDIPKVPPGEVLHSAQLRLTLAFLDRNLRPAQDVDVTVNVYWDSTAAILTQRMVALSEQRVVLDCSTLLETFHRQHNSLGGELELVVGVTDSSGQNVHPLISGDHVDKLPLLLLLYSPTDGSLSETGNDTTLQRSRRRKRDMSSEEYEEETNRIWSGTPARTKDRKTRNLCRRKPMYVEFADIHYDTWIVAPSGYEAYQCVGKCVYPLSDHLSPTKHAIIQTLLHSLQPAKTLRSCCVPTRLDSISILYLDQGVLTYRLSYKEMVVAECGCR